MESRYCIPKSAFPRANSPYTAAFIYENFQAWI